MARTRPITSDVQEMLSPPDSGSAGGDWQAALSPAEQHALHRSAPLSTEHFKAVGRLVERGEMPLSRLFRRGR